ncbi:MAG TPA: hypothetical protein VLM37_13120 [Fibrobacteraceae bacterium]|nr:hypothetical protein [Fibrobacteraceae bacterium]
MQRLWLLSLLLLLTDLFAFDGGKCGFVAYMEHQQQKKKGLARTVYPSAGSCSAEELYDSVFVDTSAHFRVFYTLTGPHAVAGADSITLERPPYIDTLLHWLENAWKLHTDTIGMKSPKGFDTTYQYEDARFPDKYPVEVVDINNLRDFNNLLGDHGGYYGLTLPDEDDPTLTELIIENDFYTQSGYERGTTTLTTDSGTCSYTPSQYAMTSSLNDTTVDYTVDWQLALRVTATHELYHACQLRYQDYNVQYHFWFEASAVGVEDQGAPDLNDYFQYLDPIFSDPEISLLSIYNNRPYGQGVFYQYLAHRFGRTFDPLIWTSLSKSPTTDIEYHFEKVLQAKGEEDGFAGVYLDYAQHMMFSGARSKYAPKDSLWPNDLPDWPELNVETTTPDSLDLPSLAFEVFPADLVPKNCQCYSSLLQRTEVTVGDSDYVILSMGIDSTSSGFVASQPKVWPNPWRPDRGQSTLCLDPATSDSLLDVRTRTGMLLCTLRYNENSSCSSGFSLTTSGFSTKRNLAPGLYYWKGRSERKLHKFLVIR